MNYIIKTADAKALRDTIISHVEKKIDPKKKEIRSWDVTTTDKDEIVLIHVTDQWEDKGNLHLNPSKNNKELEVEFKYWTKFKQEDRSGDEYKYLLGRFTELLLVHFWESGLKVEII